MPEFLKTPTGQAVFGVAVALIALIIIELNYRFFFKYLLDFVFGLVFSLLCAPVLIAGAVISYKRAGHVFEKTPYLGAKGKIIYLRSFAGINKGIKNLPRLLDVLAGKLSFVGISLMCLSDGALMDDKAMERFGTRPGIVNHLVLRGDDKLTFEEAFALDRRYVRRRELFTDMFIVLKKIVYAIRGEGSLYLGETSEKSYGETLLTRGEITGRDLEKAEEHAAEAVKSLSASKTDNFKR